MTRAPDRRRGVVVMLASALSAIAVGLVVSALDPGVSTPDVVFWRFALAAAALTPLWWRYRDRIAAGRTRVHLVRGLAGAAAVGLYFHTLRIIPVGNALALQFTAPLMIPPLAALWLSERTGRLAWAGIALAVAGAVLAAAPDPDRFAAAAALGLLSAFLSAGLAVHAKKILLGGESLVTVAFWFMLVGAAVSGVWALATAGGTAPAPGDLALLAAAGVLGTLAQIFVLNALCDLPPALFATLKLLPVPLGAAAGALLLGETPALAALVGIAAVLAGNAITARGTRA